MNDEIRRLIYSKSNSDAVELIRRIDALADRIEELVKERDIWQARSQTDSNLLQMSQRARYALLEERDALRRRIGQLSREKAVLYEALSDSFVG